MHLTHQSDSKSITTKDRRDKATNEGVSLPSRTIVHAKLEMTSPQDAEEHEADVVANEIVSGGKIRRKISQGGSGSSGIAVSSQMESQLSRLQGGGQQMPSGLQSMMEKGFGRDLSQVRLHTDSDAATMSSSIQAKAFTLGNDIYFNQGQYSPETTEGQKLVAHEVTHVVQENGKLMRQDNSDSSFNTRLELQSFYNSTLLAIMMVKAAISIFKEPRKYKNSITYFFGNYEESKNILNNYENLSKELNNIKEKKSNIDFYKMPESNRFEGKHIKETITRLIGKEKKVEVYRKISLPELNENDKSVSNNNEINITNRNKLAIILIHELSHAVFDANDNAYFGYFFDKQNGWDEQKNKEMETNVSDPKTADSYSKFAYLALYAPSLLKNDEIHSYNTIPGEKDGEYFEEKIDKTFKNFTDKMGFYFTNHDSTYNKKMYDSVFNHKRFPVTTEINNNNSELEISNNNSELEIKWNTVKEDIMKLNDISAIKNYKDNSNFDKEFLMTKYFEYMPKYINHELKTNDYKVLFWIINKNTADVYTKNFIIEQIEGTKEKK